MWNLVCDTEMNSGFWKITLVVLRGVVCIGALPLFLSAVAALLLLRERPRRTDSRLRCGVQMRVLFQAQERWCIDFRARSPAYVTQEELVRWGYLQQHFACPRGGIYLLGPAGARVRCSLENDGHWDILPPAVARAPARCPPNQQDRVPPHANFRTDPEMILPDPK